MKPLRDLGNEYCAHDALLQLSLEHRPKSYLEIGSCYGDSLMRVLAGTRGKMDHVAIADIWQVDYFGAGNNGTMFTQSHDHISRMLTEFGFTAGSHLSPAGTRRVTWLDGDSAKTVPTLGRNELFDLVLVDGDHAPEPARADLFNAWSHVAQGGFIVFDDLQHAQHMAELWTYFIRNAPDIAENQTRTNKKFGVGVAQKNVQYLETSKIRRHVLDRYPSYFGANPEAVKGVDICCSRDPLTRTCVAFDETDWPEVTRRGDARSLPFADGEFGWAWSSHALEHFEDTEAVLREWLRVIKPSGMIGLYVPNQNLYQQNSTEHKHPGFTPEQLGPLLESLGCMIVESMVHDVPGGPYPCYSTLVIAMKN